MKLFSLATSMSITFAAFRGFFTMYFVLLKQKFKCLKMVGRVFPGIEGLWGFSKFIPTVQGTCSSLEEFTILTGLRVLQDPYQASNN